MKASTAGAMLVGSSFMAAGMAMTIAVAAPMGHWSLIALGRLAIGALVAITIIRVRGALPWQRPEPWGWVRVVCAALGVPALFYAMANLPPSISVTLISTGPIWAIAGQALLQKQLPPLLSLLCLVLAGAGVGVLQGGGWQAASSVTHLAFAAALFNGMCRGGAIVSAARVTSTPASVQVIHATLGALLSTIVFVAATVDLHLQASGLSASFLGLVVAIAVLATTSNIMGTTAFQVGNAARLAPLVYLAPVFALAGEVLLWNRIPSVREVVGISIVIGASLLVRAAGRDTCPLRLRMKMAFPFSTKEIAGDGARQIVRIEQVGFVELAIRVYEGARENPESLAISNFQDELAQVSRGHGLLLAFFPNRQEIVLLAGHFVEQRVSKHKLERDFANASNLGALFSALEHEVARRMPAQGERPNEVPDEVRVVAA